MQAGARVGYEAMVRQTVEEIQRRLDDPPGFRELATRAFISPYHFHRIFRAMVGESPRELVRRLRLERAAHQLRRTPDPVVDIAFAAGYVTHEAFTKAFQAEFGASPSAFRAGGGECLGIRSRCGVHYMGSGFTAFHPVGRGGSSMRVEIVDLPSQRVAAVHHVGPYWQIGRAFQELVPRAERLGLRGRPGAFAAAAYYDDQETVPETKLRSIAGITVTGEVEIGDLDEVWLPAGRFLKGEHVGHPSGLPEAWAALYRQHLPDSGQQLRDDICFEVYVVGHEAASPERMQTDLYAPIV